MANPITIPSNALVIPVNLSSSYKTFTLPVVSTNSGRLLIFKDMFGNAANSTLRLSTIGLDRIERSSVSSMALSNAYGAWWFQNDGLTNWFLTSAYLNSLAIVAPAPPYVTSNLLYFLDAGNPSSYPGSGSTWTNLMGTGYNITLINSPTYSSANGGYLTFVPGSSQYGESLTSWPTSTRFSVEVWHYYAGTNSGTNPCIVTDIYPGTTSQMNYNLGCAPTAFPALQVAFYTGAWQSSASFSLVAGNWYHIVGTYDGANLQLYINGSLSVTNANTATPVTSTAGFRLMRRWDGGDYWGGRLAIYRFYNRALTLVEVSQNFNASRSRFGL